MAESLNVIALISGGKDSLFSLLHCLANGHKIVALANLHPPASTGSKKENEQEECEREAEGEDLNSYMYQTVGHSIVPLYAEALGIPLYRQEIRGGAVNTEREYSYAPTTSSTSSSSSKGEAQREGEEEQDETESLLPLLRKALAAHPSANAISTGAILSTYQRTRVESIALRLGLTPLSFLWQYPILPPYSQSGLLNDMAAIDQDSRIIKVASGGLDESFLWANVADPRTVGGLRRAMGRFGGNGDGAVLGEGGEYETLAVDGPGVLWKGRIVVEGEGEEVVRGEGRSALVRVKGARVEMKGEEGRGGGSEGLRIPGVWDEEFVRVLGRVEDVGSGGKRQQEEEEVPSTCPRSTVPSSVKLNIAHSTTSTLTLSNLAAPSSSSTDQLTAILHTLSSHLSTNNLTPASISHTTLLLRHMSDFASMNKTYSAAFDFVNPPSRVTVACGETMPEGVDVMMSVLAEKQQEDGGEPGERKVKRKRKGLHVQSRSYWAPANIGPYSQGISVPLPSSHPLRSAGDQSESSISPRVAGGKEEREEGEGGDESGTPEIQLIYPAGQIPLLPSSMTLHTGSFAEQTALSLQHLWRVGRAMDVRWWTVGVAYLAHCGEEEIAERLRIASETWRCIHEEYLALGKEAGADEEEEEEEIDPWDLKNRFHGSLPGGVDEDITVRAALPDPSVLDSPSSTGGENRRKEVWKCIPPLVIPQVATLPRDAPIEWWSLGLGVPEHTDAGPFKVRLRTAEETGGGGVHVTEVVGTSTRVFALYVESAVVMTVQGARERIIRAVQAVSGTEGVDEGVGGQVEWEHGVLFAGPELGSEWVDVVEGVQWVPCERVWGGGDGHGLREVAGVVVGRVSVY